MKSTSERAFDVKRIDVEKAIPILQDLKTQVEESKGPRVRVFAFRYILFTFAIYAGLLLLYVTKQVRIRRHTNIITNQIISTSPSQISVQATKQVLTQNWSEQLLSDGMVQFEYQAGGNYPSTNSSQSLIIFSLIYDQESWAHTVDLKRNRTEEDFFDLVASQVDISKTSFGFLTDDRKVYKRLKKASVKRNLKQATILYHNDTTTFSRKNRHADEIQYQRRSNLAVLRNILMSRSLKDEKHVFWLDSDVIEMTPNLINTMISKADDNKKEVGLVTARSDLISMKNYDKNSWGLDREVKPILLAVNEDGRQALNTRLIDTRKFIPEQTRGLVGDQLARLDSVGGSNLYIRADLIRKGVHFPPYKIVGTTWGQEGWTGQETEGICYTAKRTAGVGCWSLNDFHYSIHASQ